MRRLRSPPLRFLSSGGAGEAVAALAQAEFDEFRVDAALAFARRREVRAADGGGEVDVLLDGEEGVEGVLVGDVGDVGGQDVVEVLVEREAVEEDRAAHGLQVAGEHAEQGALAAAARAHDADHLAALGAEA